MITVLTRKRLRVLKSGKLTILQLYQNGRKRLSDIPAESKILIKQSKK